MRPSAQRVSDMLGAVRGVVCRAVVVTSVAMILGCSVNSAFNCQTDDDCGADGRCEESGYCSFPDGRV